MYRKDFVINYFSKRVIMLPNAADGQVLPILARLNQNVVTLLLLLLYCSKYDMVKVAQKLIGLLT